MPPRARTHAPPRRRHLLPLLHGALALALVGLRPGRASAGNEQDLSAPEDLAVSRCLGADGRLDFGGEYHVFHLEVVELGGDAGAGGGAGGGRLGAAAAYVAGRVSANGCGEDARIDTESECKAAAAALGKPFSASGAWGNAPAGCLFDVRGAFYNMHATGGCSGNCESLGMTPICARRSARAVGQVAESGNAADAGATAHGRSDALRDPAGVTIDLLDELGRAGRRCQFQRMDGRRALYACNSAAHGLAVHGPHAARFAPCDVSVWGEPVAKASRMLALAHDLYQRANLKGAGCTECKEPLDILQTCARIALVRATGGDVEFSRWLAACTNDAGTIWLRKGKHERALQMFRRALPLIGNHPIVILNIVQVALRPCHVKPARFALLPACGKAGKAGAAPEDTRHVRRWRASCAPGRTGTMRRGWCSRQWRCTIGRASPC